MSENELDGLRCAQKIVNAVRALDNELDGLRCAQKIVNAVRALDNELADAGETNQEVANTRVAAIFDQFVAEMPEQIRTQYADRIKPGMSDQDKSAIKISCIGSCWQTFFDFPFEAYLSQFD